MVINFKLHVKQELTLHTTVKLSYCPMQLLPVMIKAGLGGTIIKKINASHSFFSSFHTCSVNPEAESSRFTGPSTVGGCDVGLIVHIGGQSSQ